MQKFHHHWYLRTYKLNHHLNTVMPGVKSSKNKVVSKSAKRRKAPPADEMVPAKISRNDSGIDVGEYMCPHNEVFGSDNAPETVEPMDSGPITGENLTPNDQPFVDWCCIMCDEPSSVKAEDNSQSEDMALFVKDLTTYRMFSLTYKTGDSAMTLIQYDNAEGTGVPKQLALTLQRWLNLVCNEGLVTRALKDVQNGDTIKEELPLGGGFHAVVESPYWSVNIRRYYKKQDGSLGYTPDGLCLNWREWSKLIDAGTELSAVVGDIVPCVVNHSTQIDFLTCVECNPYTAVSARKKYDI
jgi:hypothetical protein